MKRLLRGIERGAEGLFEAIDRLVFGIGVVILGLKPGNVYSPSWAPETRDWIVDATYPYVTYTGFRPVPELPGQWVQGGRTKQPSLWGFWIEHEFVQYAPIGTTGLTLR